MSYIRELKNLVDRLGSYGIVTLLDFHQDLLSEYFCGEGMPDWAVFVDNSTFTFPGPIVPLTFDRDPQGKCIHDNEK